MICHSLICHNFTMNKFWLDSDSGEVNTNVTAVAFSAPIIFASPFSFHCLCLFIIFAALFCACTAKWFLQLFLFLIMNIIMKNFEWKVLIRLSKHFGLHFISIPGLYISKSPLQDGHIIKLLVIFDCSYFHITLKCYHFHPSKNSTFSVFLVVAS